MLEPKYIVKFGEEVPAEATENSNIFLRVSEFFWGTIQGEGVYAGQPAAFLRLSGCPVGCKFCDSEVVWKNGQNVSVEWLVNQILTSGLASQLLGRMHLVITGGSPLLQQKQLLVLLSLLRYAGVRPFIEVENECAIMPYEEFIPWVDCWNNSPKLANSEVDIHKRFKPAIFQKMGSLPNSWFKFVVRSEEDCIEIEDEYIRPGYITEDQVILMPMGGTQEEYFKNREAVVELAVKYGFRYSPREHIAIWDKKTGI